MKIIAVKYIGKGNKKINPSYTLKKRIRWIEES